MCVSVFRGEHCVDKGLRNNDLVVVEDEQNNHWRFLTRLHIGLNAWMQNQTVFITDFF